jgi:hypothetical protein
LGRDDDEQLLDALRPANATVEATRSVLQTQVDTLRKRRGNASPERRRMSQNDAQYPVFA